MATDISTRALEAASGGRYPCERFDKVPMHEVSPFLLRGSGRAEGWYLVRPEVRRLITFRRLNLMKIGPGLGSFSVIFCRNVMIYFDQPTQQQVVSNLIDHLEPGGYLFIGHSESLNRLSHGLQYEQPAVYRKPAAGVSASAATGSREAQKEKR